MLPRGKSHVLSRATEKQPVTWTRRRRAAIRSSRTFPAHRKRHTTKLLELSQARRARTRSPRTRDPRRRDGASTSHNLIDIDESFSMWPEVGCFYARRNTIRSCKICRSTCDRKRARIFRRKVESNWTSREVGRVGRSVGGRRRGVGDRRASR